MDMVNIRICTVIIQHLESIFLTQVPHLAPGNGYDWTRALAGYLGLTKGADGHRPINPGRRDETR